MERRRADYEKLATSLLEDFPIKELGSDKVLCWRIATDREIDASKAITELLATLNDAIEDLKAYPVCGLCKSYRPDCQQYGHCKIKKGRQTITERSSGCGKWEWKGKTLSKDKYW